MTAEDSSTSSQQRSRDLTGFSPKAKAWRSFFETSAIISDRMEKRLQATTGLKLSDYNLLLILAEAPGKQLRMGELAERMVFSPSRLSYQVKSLAGRGLLERCMDPHDKRGMTACLTEEGSTVFAAASKVHAQHIRQLFHPALDDAQAVQLRQICEAIYHTVTTADEPC
ncbi:MarR family winged helix-turn-helix transcriptional regulator [Nesterenkonia flava]|uniref:MarR family winged helix-turn-helix transcriptional regulator n=1 Tax=Nesterenkonia flava TaxID=469799 RepID=A0ABU1FTX9_9MICC|nr:MarR family winged helix-turn-helix transcriptional regulator [Nesterenkonia flava]MDR5711633.1 MarR family winged helix-turn-helix transcriptional regulator [Nesterenkonia flava]